MYRSISFICMEYIVNGYRLQSSLLQCCTSSNEFLDEKFILIKWVFPWRQMSKIRLLHNRFDFEKEDFKILFFDLF